MAAELREKVVLLTGASKGLGAQTAAAFARRGARIALVARSTDRLERVADDVRSAGGEPLVCPADVTDLNAINRVVDDVLHRWQRIDVLVNGAGVKREGAVADGDANDVRDTLAVNYLAAFHFCRAVLPTMLDQKNGRIINVSSVLGLRATPQRGPYSASKAALIAVNDALRVEVRSTGVTVSLVCPGRLADGEQASRFAMGNLKAAEAIVRCAIRPKRRVVLTTAGKVLHMLNFFAPALVDRILTRARRNERE